MNKYIYDKITDILEENDIHISEFVEYVKRQLKTKYYIEFVDKESSCDFLVQSKWFNSIEDAKQWLNNTFDYLDIDALSIFLMKADFDANGNYGDITQVEDLTKETYSKIINKE